MRLPGGAGTAAEKVRALKEAGVRVCASPATIGADIVALMTERAAKGAR